MTLSPVPTEWQPKTDILRTLFDRGYVHQASNLQGLDAAFERGGVPTYVGFDATADSLHVGHLLPIMMLRRMQKAGHKPIVLVGGGTTRIGDPSFRSEERPMLTDAQISANIAGIGAVFSRFLRFGDGATDAVLVDNAEWLNKIHYIDFLRDVGAKFSVNRMLTFESVRSRLDRQESLSFLEFNYMILQAYDFVELSRRLGVGLQMGGSDQWGNIVNGIELVRRMDEEEVFGLTAPLLTTSSGSKMGKTASGAVWLNAQRLSAYDYWQFWRNTEDRDVARFMRLFTDLPEEEIEPIDRMEGAALNIAKERLAHEATALLHGEGEALAAGAVASDAFGGRGASDGLPVLTLSEFEADRGLALDELLVRASLSTSRSEARRSIAGRGVRLNGEIETESEFVVRGDSLPLRLSLGRKRHVTIRSASSGN